MEKNQTGFTYLMVLVAIAILAIFAQVASPLNSRVTQADKEAELMFRGLAYREAIKNYFLAGETLKTYPRSLEDLSQDPRFIYKRHLRKQYPDPFSNNDWVILKAEDGGIRGVVSSSSLKPLKQNGFPASLAHFENAKTYKDWIFEYLPSTSN